MLNQALVHRIHKACTSAKAMDYQQGRLTYAFAFLVIKLEDALVTQDYGPYAHHLSITEAKLDVLSLDVLDRNRAQL